MPLVTLAARSCNFDLFWPLTLRDDQTLWTRDIVCSDIEVYTEYFGIMKYDQTRHSYSTDLHIQTIEKIHEQLAITFWGAVNASIAFHDPFLGPPR